MTDSCLIDAGLWVCMNAGVNVAAFLLMDSQKDSTSPGHAETAKPAQGKLQTTDDTSFTLWS